MPARQKYLISSSRHQRGAILMLLLLLVSVGALAVFVSGLNRASQQQERDRVTSEALARAKAALVGRALTDDNRPGSLPCPDADDDGVAESACTASLVGRFPWKTLKTGDLRDGSGERLWYELSANYQDQVASEPLNSNTSGTLDGGGVAAKIYSPGPVMATQDRSPANVNVLSNYIEGVNDLVSRVSDRDIFLGVRKRIAGEVQVLLALPYPDVMPVPAMPLRFNLNGWDTIVSYIKDSDTQSRLFFAGCPAWVIQFNWNAALGRNDVTWTGAC